MNLDIEIYLSNFKDFFKRNPNDLSDLIGEIDKQKFFELVEKNVIKNHEKGEYFELTKNQVIEIIIELKKSKIVDNTIIETNFGKIYLN
jgi:hypothetical protein